MSDRRPTAVPHSAAVSPGARLLTMEARFSRLAGELPARATPPQLVGAESEWNAARLATRRSLRAAWTAGAIGGRSATEHIAAAATLALPAWAAATVAGGEAAAIVAEAADGAIAEVARTNGDTARAYLLDATTLGLPVGPLVAVGVVIAARPEPALLRRRLTALRAIGERGRLAALAGAEHLTPAARTRLERAPLRTLLIVQAAAAALVPMPHADIEADGVLVLDAAGRPDAASSTPSVVARLAAISRGRAAARTVAAAAIIGERAVAPV